MEWKKVIWLCAWCLLYFGVHEVRCAYDNPEKGMWPESPTAAQFREVISPTPALLTGAAELVMPIYTVEAEGLSIPFTLHYFSNGVKRPANQCPVGLGWTLTPPLRVTRQILGRPDGVFAPTVESFSGELSYEECFKSMNNAGYGNEYVRFKRDWTDTEHDLYTFHMLDRTFKAIWHGNKFHTLDCDEYRIEADSILSKITVTDSEGRIFHFDTRGEYIDNPVFCLEWLLSSVTLPSGREIAISWITTSSHPYNVSGSNEKSFTFERHPTGQLYNDLSEDYVRYGPDYHNQSFPGTVTFPGGYMKFKYTGSVPGQYQLLSEILLNGGNGEFRKAAMTYDVFRLASLYLAGEGLYEFEYYPSKGGNGIDWWGYPNGKSHAHHGASPSVKLSLDRDSQGRLMPIDYVGSDRSIDAEAMKAQLLRKVTYPTGGIIEWEYEPHRFAPVSCGEAAVNRHVLNNTTLSEGGGLRVKSVTLRNGESDQAPLVRRYVYGVDGNGLAVCRHAPTLDSFISDKTLFGYYSYEIGGAFGSTKGFMNLGLCTLKHDSDYLQYQLGLVPIWYERVEERAPEGCTVWEFTDLCPDNEIDRSMWRIVRPMQIWKAFSAGPQLTRRTMYKGHTGAYEKVSEEAWTYELRAMSRSFNNIFIVRNINCPSGQSYHAPDYGNSLSFAFTGMGVARNSSCLLYDPSGFGRYSFGPYDVYSQYAYHIHPRHERLVAHNVTEYFSGGGRIDSGESYEYRSGTGIVSKVKRNGFRSIETEYIFPDAAASEVERDMVSRNMVGIILGECRFLNHSPVHYRKDLMARFGSTFRAARKVSRRGNNTSWTSGYCDYDSNGNLIYSDDGTGVATYLRWDAAGRYPVRKQVGPLISNAQWKGLVGVSELIDPAGVRMFYKYDSESRLISERLIGHGNVKQYFYNIAHGASWVGETVCTSDQIYDTPERITRYDALGRVSGVVEDWSKQPGSVDIESGQTNKIFSASLIQYDVMGRPWRQWSPAPVKILNPSETEIISAANGFYGASSSPYYEMSYEESARKLPLWTRKAGEEWKKNDKTEKYARMVNTGSLNCRFYKVESGGVTCSGDWPSGVLLVELTRDEDGRLLWVFTDELGRKVLERRGLYPPHNDTYYVYDDLGDLRYILPPGLAGMTGSLGRNNKHVSRLAYWYDYDNRGRLVTKKLPGVPEYHYVYDNADRLIAECTPDLAEAGRWRLYFHDNAGREVLVVETTAEPSEIEGFAESRAVSLASGNEKSGGYALGVTVPGMILVYADYYDNYDFISVLSLGEEFGFDASGAGADFTLAPRATVNTGRRTGRHFGGSSAEVYYYDAFGREIQRYGTGYGSGRTSREYAYQGQVLHERHDFPATSPGLPRMLVENCWGLFGRLERREIHMGDSVTTTMKLGYDNLGRLSSRTTGARVTQRFDYDVHGWLSAIHDEYVGARRLSRVAPSDPISGLQTNTETVRLSYAGGRYPSYTGKISRVSGPRGTYQYRYDDFGRLDRADYTPSEGGKGNFSVAYGYDERANVTSLTRHGVIDRTDSGEEEYGVLDDITATYSGNQLIAISNSTEAAAFAGRAGIGRAVDVTLSYDGAGRLIADPTRNISDVSYNTWGLPSVTCFSSTDIFGGVKQPCLSTSYDGAGRLTSTMFNPDVNSTSVHTPFGYKQRHYYASGLITTRTNRLSQLETVERIQFPGGYFDSRLRPHYYLVDHQGNHVAVVDKSGRDVQRTDYYPYGEPHRRSTSSTLTHETSENGYLYSGKEYFNVRGMDQYDFGARQYAPTLPHFTTPDPHAESTPSISPYAYCAGNPVMYVDPTGCDSIYIFEKGNFRTIGYTNATDPNRYIVTGEAAQSVMSATSAGMAINPMGNSDNTVVLPSKAVLEEAHKSMLESNKTGKEQGGHQWADMEEILRWDSGKGYNYGRETNSIEPFMVDGILKVEAYKVTSYWHVHPYLYDFPKSGQSTPSSRDMDWETRMRKGLYQGFTFLIGGRKKDVTFYYNTNTILTAPLDKLLRLW